MEWSRVMGAPSCISRPIHYYEKADQKFAMGSIVDRRDRRSWRSLFSCLVVAARLSVDNGEDLAAVAARLRRADTRDVEELFLVDRPGTADGGQGAIAEDPEGRNPAPPRFLEAPLAQLLEKRRFRHVERRLMLRDWSHNFLRPHSPLPRWCLWVPGTYL